MDTLPGPLFAPRPGWGGQLRAWLQGDGSLALFRLLVFAAAVLIISSLAHSLRAPHVAQIMPSPSATGTSYAFIAAAGQSMTHLVTLALTAYVTQQHIALDSAERLCAITTLTQTKTHPLVVGEQVIFSSDTLAQAVITAKTLTSLQHSAWQRLVR